MDLKRQKFSQERWHVCYGNDLILPKQILQDLKMPAISLHLICHSKTSPSLHEFYYANILHKLQEPPLI